MVGLCVCVCSGIEGEVGIRMNVTCDDVSSKKNRASRDIIARIK